MHPPRKPPFSDICESGEPTAANPTCPFAETPVGPLPPLPPPVPANEPQAPPPPTPPPRPSRPLRAAPPPSRGGGLDWRTVSSERLAEVGPLGVLTLALLLLGGVVCALRSRWGRQPAPRRAPAAPRRQAASPAAKRARGGGGGADEWPEPASTTRRSREALVPAGRRGRAGATGRRRGKPQPASAALTAMTELNDAALQTAWAAAPAATADADADDAACQGAAHRGISGRVDGDASSASGSAPAAAASSRKTSIRYDELDGDLD